MSTQVLLITLVLKDYDKNKKNCYQARHFWNLSIACKQTPFCDNFNENNRFTLVCIRESTKPCIFSKLAIFKTFWQMLKSAATA